MVRPSKVEGFLFRFLLRVFQKVARQCSWIQLIRKGLGFHLEYEEKCQRVATMAVTTLGRKLMFWGSRFGGFEQGLRFRVVFRFGVSGFECLRPQGFEFSGCGGRGGGVAPES